MIGLVRRTTLVIAAVVMLQGTTLGADIKLPAVRMIIRQNTATGTSKVAWVSKLGTLPLPTVSPLTTGATFKVIGGNQTNTTALPATNWKVNSAGTLYKFVNKDAPGGSSLCKVAMIKQDTVFKVVCKDSVIDLDDTTQGTVMMNLATGADNYCSACSGSGHVIKDEPGRFIAKGCSVPTACSAAVPTTTSSTTTTTTSVSTTEPCPTTTTLGVPSCAGSPAAFCSSLQCPGGQTCADDGSGRCACSGAFHCGGSDSFCGGDCPPGESCRPLPVPAGCPSIGCDCQ